MRTSLIKIIHDPYSLWNSSERKDELSIYPRGFCLNKTQIKKITAVGIAALALLTLQMGLTFKIAGSVALGCSLLTAICEKNLREAYSVDWFNTKNLNRRFFDFFIGMMGVTLIQQLASGCFKPPIQSIAQLILSGHLLWVGIAIITAPICEEILYRGFLYERLEDMAYVIDQHVYALTVDTQARIAFFVQAILFGYMHITGSQVEGLRNKVIVAFGSMQAGIFHAWLKDSEESLLAPICFHIGNNGVWAISMKFSQVFGEYFKP